MYVSAFNCTVNKFCAPDTQLGDYVFTVLYTWHLLNEYVFYLLVCLLFSFVEDRGPAVRPRLPLNSLCSCLASAVAVITGRTHRAQLSR